MRKFTEVLLPLILLVLWFVPLRADEAVEGSQMNSVLASVNGHPITLMDVLQLTRLREIQARSVYSGERLNEEIQRYRKDAVDDLIDNLLIQAEFEKFGFSLSSQDVEREIDRIATRIGCHSRTELERRLRREGSSIEEVRMTIRNNMMVQMMIYRQIRIADPVSPREVYEYYQQNESTFSTPEKVCLAMLKLDASHPAADDEAVLISTILKDDPAQFAALVGRYSPALGNGGELGEIERRLLRPEFAAAFTEFIPGAIVGPIRVYDGFVWLKVISHTPAVLVPFADVEQTIKLELEQRNRERIITGYAARLRGRAMIEYYF